MEIEFNHVSFIVDLYTPLEKTILSDVSFKIDKVGIYSFVGASNSGKTSVGDLINALISPTRGCVKIGKFVNDGSKIKNINKLRYETGYVFKNPYDMFFNKTVKSEIEFGMKYFKYKTKKMEMRTMDALTLVGLDESYLKLNPQILDLVDAKKVALACVLAYNPSIIILDEFTTGLGAKDKANILRLLKVLKNNYNKTIILLTKDTNFAYQASDEVFLMNKTKLVASGKKNLLTDIELLTNLNLEVPPIVSFVSACNKKNHDITYTNNVLDLIKEVYRDVF